MDTQITNNPTATQPNGDGASTGGGQPSKPVGDGGGQPSKPADNKVEGTTAPQNQPRKTHGIPPQKLTAIKRQMYTEVEADVRARLEQEKAEQEGNFEKSYKSAKTKLERLEPEVEDLRERVSRYEGVLETQLDARIAKWPKEALKRDPKTLNPDGYSLMERIEWADTVEALATSLGTSLNAASGEEGGEGEGKATSKGTTDPLAGGTSKSRSNGNPGGPPPAGSNASKEKYEEYVQKRNAEYALPL